MVEKVTVDDVRPLEIGGYCATGLVEEDPSMPRPAVVHDSGNHLCKLLYMAPRRTFRDLDKTMFRFYVGWVSGAVVASCSDAETRKDRYDRLDGKEQGNCQV
jgi:hypothetical protein